MAQTTVAINLEAKTKGTESVKSLKSQIREATQEAVALAEKFGEFSPEAQKATARVANLKEQMSEFQERVAALSPEKFSRIGTVASGLAQGMQAAQGAMALFGAESEDVQKALLKVQGAMALSQGLEGLDKAGNQLKSLGAKGIEAFKGMTNASKVFMATGLGLLLTALGAVVAYWDDIAVSLGFAKSEMEKMTSTINAAGQATQTQAADLNFYNSIVQDTTKSEAERKFALNELKKAGIETDDININNAESMQLLTNRTKENILIIAQRARTEAAAQILQEKTKKLIEMQNGGLDEQLSIWDRFTEAAKSSLTAGIYVQNLQEKANKNLKKAQDEVTESSKLYVKERDASLPGEAKKLAAQEEIKNMLDRRKKSEQAASQAAQKAAQEEEARQLELKKRSEQLIADAELAGKTEVQRAEILAKRKFDASIKGFKEGSVEYIAAEKIYNDEVTKIRTDAAKKQKDEEEKTAKERKDFIDSQNESMLKSIDTYYKAEETLLVQRNAKQPEFDALEIERLNAQREALIAIKGQGSAEVVAIEAELAKKQKEIRDKEVDETKKAEEAKRQMKIDTLNSVGQIFGSLAQLSGENEKAQKAFGLAQIAVDTAVALSNAQASAMSPTSPDNLATGGLAGIAKYASYVAIILSNAAKARQILKGGGASGSSGGGAAGAAGAAPAPAVPMAGGALPEEGQFGGMGRVYVLEGDITKTQTRVRRLRNTSVV